MGTPDNRAPSGTARTPNPPHVVELEALTGWARLDVDGCRDCRPLEDGLLALCGWHENLSVAARAVAAAADLLDRDR